MKIFITISKKSLYVILAVIIIILLVASKVFYLTSANNFDGSTNQKRVDYILNLGFQVDETPIFEKQITIPKTFDEVYKKYNSLQSNAGFDLSNYKGKSAKVIAYKVKNEEKQVTLIIYKDRIIGGDVSSPQINGKMEPLKSGKK